jgi:hypothetical protein
METVEFNQILTSPTPARECTRKPQNFQKLATKLQAHFLLTGQLEGTNLTSHYLQVNLRPKRRWP